MSDTMETSMPDLTPSSAVLTLIQTLVTLLRQRLAGQSRVVLVLDPSVLSPDATAALDVVAREALMVRRLT